MALNARKAALVLALILGLLAVGSVLWVYPGCPGLPARLYHTLLSNHEYAVARVEFNKRMAGGGRLPNGQRFSFNVSRSSDCVDVEFTSENYGSAEDAQQRMHDIVASAHDVLERNDKLYTNGESAGPRAVLLLEHRDKQAMIIWSMESKVVMIESSSLPHAREFERRYHNRIATREDLEKRWKTRKPASSEPE